MRFWVWCIGCWLALAGAAWAAVPPDVLSVRRWVAPSPEADQLAQAEAALAGLPRERLPRGTAPEFRLAAGEAAWYALEISPLARPAVLELTHPSLRSVDLYQPGQPEPVARGGRDRPAAERLHHRFPAALSLPAWTETRTVVVRAFSVVPARGQFELNGRPQWEMLSRLQIAGMALGFGVSLLAALYALLRAAVARSPAYLWYSLLTFTIAAAGVLINGVGEAVLWPRLGPWRGQLAALLACVASGLALLLAERAFALEISAPRFARALLVLGLALPVAGLLALPWPLPMQQLVSHGAVLAASVMGLASIWLAWRTANPVAGWLLAGYVPVVLGVAVVTLALAGVMPYAEWLLLVMPMAGLCEIPFNLHGLKLLERRRAGVRRSREHLAALAGPDGESREEVATRLTAPPVEADPAGPGCTLLLARLQGLAPGAAALRELDSARLEQYIQSLLAAALRPGGRAGRWAFHEILVRDGHHRNERELNGLVTALFAAALRSESFGVPAGVPQLRIAYVRVLTHEVPVRGLARQLGRALDDPLTRDLRRIDLDPWTD